jgi:cyclopropane fatty-acyl-phospholipid synthase-like methyltransferase
MFKYIMIALALKMFSISPQTKRLYRLLGNTLGQKRRVQHGLDRQHVDRAKRILELCERHHAIQKGDKLLEIGTGWIHWESTIIRLFYDVEITLFDVWDNRHFEAYKHYFGQLETIIDKELHMDTMRRERVHKLLQEISKASSFDEIYNLLGFRYVTNPSGTLKQFQDESFAVIFSCNVLEHVDRSILPKFIQDFHRLLKPGGLSIQKIDPGDHLAYLVQGYFYDKNVSQKNYLRYSDRVWRRFFENNVQYFNRVQRSEWLDLFHKAGFEVVEEESISTNIDTININKHYANLDRQDLQCVTLRIVHRKSY